MREIDHLILGGGSAAVAAATTLRLEGATGSVLMLSADDTPPYYRPALSKQYLIGTASADQILIHPEDFYREQDIELSLGDPVTSVDTTAGVVSTKGGGQFHHQRLLIATGSVALRLVIPGVDLPGVHHIRSRAECEQMHKQIAGGARRAVVLGASFLGMEIAMSLVDLGLEVTVVEQRDHILPHIESRTISQYFREHAEERGVRFLLSDTVAAIHGTGRISSVETNQGAKLPCDLLAVSIGVGPASDFLAGSGIALDDEGLVMVDDQLRTNVENVFAAGDVTNFFDPVFARRRHIEHWDNAIKQGRLAARNMLDRRIRYDEVSYFFCDIGDYSFSMVGAPEEARDRIARGSLADRSMALLYLKDDVPRALFSVGRPVEETRSAEGLIRFRVNLRDVKERLADPAFPLDHIPTQTALVLQGGGAMGAFEAGVVQRLEEERIYPDIVAGVSIGALNGAIVAGNPGHASEALRSFWDEIAVASPWAPASGIANLFTSAQILTFGVPNFFRPRWLSSWLDPLSMPLNWTSLYDVAPMKELIARYVDFSTLKASPVRLLVGAVNIETGELEVFDSYVDDLTPDHVLASGSLPPGFPWTEIEGRAYWDGGIISNSPLDIVIDRCGPDGKRVFIVDLYEGRRPRPSNILEVLMRRDEIVYSERVRSDLRVRELVSGYRDLVDNILDVVDPAIQARIRQRPLYIELMGDGAPMEITRFVREGREGEQSSRDYDFSAGAIRQNHDQGYQLAKQTLARLARGAESRAVDPQAPALAGRRSLPAIGESDRLAEARLTRKRGARRPHRPDAMQDEEIA